MGGYPVSILYLKIYIYIPLSYLLEKAMAPHSSTLAWKIPRMEEPVGCSPWGR